MNRMHGGRYDTKPNEWTTVGLYAQPPRSRDDRNEDAGDAKQEDCGCAAVIGCGRRGLSDGTALCAAMHRPHGVCAFQLGSAATLAFTDCYNNAIRLVMNAEKGSSSFVCTVENAGLLKPKGICASEDHRYLFVCDTGHHRIKFATLPSSIDAITDGDDTSARRNHIGRSIELFSFAGSGEKTWRDGPVLQAGFNAPAGVCECSDGTIMVADTGNRCIRAIRRSSVGGGLVVTTIAGGLRQSTGLLVGQSRAGHKDGEGHEALFRSPSAVIEGPCGELLVADTMNHCIRALVSTIRDGTEVWSVSTVCGRPQRSGYADGSCATSLFCQPIALCRGPTDTIFVSDAGNKCIRQIGRMAGASAQCKSSGYLPYTWVRTFDLAMGIARSVSQRRERGDEHLVPGLVYSSPTSINKTTGVSRGRLWLCNTTANIIEQIQVDDIKPETEDHRQKQSLTSRHERFGGAVMSDTSSSDARSVSSGYTASSSTSASDESTTSYSSRHHQTSDTVQVRTRSSNTSKLSQHNATLRHQNASLRQLLEQTLAEITNITNTMAEVQSFPVQQERRRHRHRAVHTSIKLH